jgi:hypothetical protein
MTLVCPDLFPDPKSSLSDFDKIKKSSPFHPILKEKINFRTS